MKKENRKVGRPKLANSKLRKNSLIISTICIVFAIILMVGGLISLNVLPNFLKLKGTVYKTYKLGDEFCLGEECFYVLEDNGDSVKALAKYNLLVGNTNEVEIVPTEYGYNQTNIISSEPISSSTLGYGHQSDIAKGGLETSTTWVGTIEYAPSGSIQDNYSHESTFNENSSLWVPIQNYQTYLRQKGYNSLDVTLPSMDDFEDVGEYLKSVGCEYNSEIHKTVCPENVDFIHSSSYWLKSSSGTYVDYVAGGTDGGDMYHTTEYSNNTTFGVRPLITINKEDFAEELTGDDALYALGQKFCLNGEKECFYIINSDDDTVTALSEYNLLVGDKYIYENADDETPQKITLSENDEDYGLQSDKATVDFENNIITGSVAFSNEVYWDEYERIGEYSYVYDDNSNLYKYLNDYENYLKNNLGKSSVKATLISRDELIDLGCDSDCTGSYSWVYSSTYWIGSARGEYVLGVVQGGGFDYDGWSIDTQYFGVRPLITISKEDIKENQESEEKNDNNNESVTTTKENKNSNVEENITTKNNNIIKKSRTKEKTNEKVVTTKEQTTSKVTKDKEITTKVYNFAKKINTKKMKEEKKINLVIPIVLSSIGLILAIILIVTLSKRNKK